MKFLKWKCMNYYHDFTNVCSPVSSEYPALVQIMAWRRPGDKPLSGPMMVSLLTHICVTRPQWVWRLPIVWSAQSNAGLSDLARVGKYFNPLAPGKFEWNFRYVIFKWILVIDVWGFSYRIALRWMSLGFTDDQSTLVQVMAWCRQATSHYLSQCWPRSLSPYGVTRPQWVYSFCPHVLGTLYLQRLTEVWAWISNHIQGFIWYVISHLHLWAGVRFWD